MKSGQLVVMSEQGAGELALTFESGRAWLVWLAPLLFISKQIVAYKYNV